MAKSSFKLEIPSASLELHPVGSLFITDTSFPVTGEKTQVIVEKGERSEVPDTEKKYLVSDWGQFNYVVRKRINPSAEKAIFIFVKNMLPPTAVFMSAIYDEHKIEDGFFYMTYSGENTIGFYE